MQVLALPDSAVLLRVFFLAASVLILVIQAVPALKVRFLAYGSRATTPSSGPPAGRPSGRIDHVLDSLASVRVPHNYFTHFYLVSVACSLFWGWRMGVSVNSLKAVEPVQIAWLLMLLQGIRRMNESHSYTSSSQSEMWFGHWILGLIFYVTINAAIWVDGTAPAIAEGTRGSYWKLAILAPAILTCHALQHSYHAYLFRLRTANSSYQLPSHPVFPNLLCPHYTCETMIYLLLSFLAVPAGRTVNWTVLCGAVFVAVNLGVTASGTKEWYEQRFGVEKVRGRKRMVPWVW